MKNKMLLLVLLYMIIGSRIFAQTSCRESDSLELVKFYINFNGNNWKDNFNWLKPGKPINTWIGVSTNSEGCVINISLNENNLIGKLYNFNFPNLSGLYLQNNQIHGSIPDFIYLPKLINLYLNYNNLSGSIPDFTKLSSLSSLQLNGNQLLGAIPDFANLPNLEILKLGVNKINGNIPDFSNLPFLVTLEIFANNLTGTIPNFSNLPRLNYLDLSSNQLSGILPTFANINLTFLNLSNNYLSGALPDFNNFGGLRVLNLSKNKFNNNIPNFSKLFFLTSLDLSSNEFSGAIPDFSDLTIIESMNFSSNQLSGIIPDLSDLLLLNYLDISKNKFTFSDIGQLPGFIGNLIYSPQDSIYFDTTIITQVGDSFTIDLFVDSLVQDNVYTWTKNAQSWIPNAPNTLSRNKLIFKTIDENDYGRYQVNVTNSKLPKLILFSRIIILKIINRTRDSMQLINLYNSTNGPKWNTRTNWLVPDVPVSEWYGVTIDTLGFIRKLNLCNNNLSGALPSLNLNAIDTLILCKNNLLGNIPELQIPFIHYLDLSDNQFSGELPKILFTWLDIQQLNLGYNKFTGIIPPDLGDLCELNELRLNNNDFIGEFPERLTLLHGLEQGKVDFKNNFRTIANLSDKFIFFCQLGDSIFLNNKCYNRFRNLCKNTCTGNEWKQLSNYPWIIDTLFSLKCITDSCVKSYFQAGFVEVHNLKLFYIRNLCYKNSELTEFSNFVKLYDCMGNLFGNIYCASSQPCFNNVNISDQQIDSLIYEDHWNCGDSIEIFESLDKNVWQPLSCNPNLVNSFSICNVMENDNPISVSVYNLNGGIIELKYTIQEKYITLFTENIIPGIYFIIVKSNKTMYRTKLIKN